jgi:hypothetical protein
VPVTIFLSLSSVWQVVLAVALVLVSAYFLLSMTGTILKPMTGELWTDSLVLGHLTQPATHNPLREPSLNGILWTALHLV